MSALNLGIDLGTESITIYAQGKGILISEANAVCYEKQSGDVVAVGNAAKAMLERTPDAFRVVRPMDGGVISDFRDMQNILAAMIDRICQKQVFRPNVVVTAPSGITALQKRTIIDVVTACGAAKVSLLDHAIASALGAGIEISHPHGVLVLDVGAGTADIAVITMGTVAYTTACRFAGDAADEQICRYLRRERNLLIGLPTAARIKKTIGCAKNREEEIELLCSGKDYISQRPVSFRITSREVSEALEPWTRQLSQSVLAVLDQTPPELYSDICAEGIVLCGGMAHLYGLDQALQDALNIKVNVAADGEHCAAKGAGLSLPQLKTLEDHGYLFRLKERY